MSGIIYSGRILMHQICINTEIWDLNIASVVSIHLQPHRQRSDWRIDHRVTPAFSSSALKQWWWCLYDTSPGKRRGGEKEGAKEREVRKERGGMRWYFKGLCMENCGTLTTVGPRLRQDWLDKQNMNWKPNSNLQNKKKKTYSNSTGINFEIRPKN